MITPTVKQLEFLNSDADITVWSAGYGAGSTTLLLLQAFHSNGDTVVIDPTFSPSRFNVYGAYESELVKSKCENCIELINGKKLLFFKTYREGLFQPNVIIQHAHLMDNSQMKFIANFNGKIKILTQVTFDTKKWIRKLVLGMLSCPDKNVWFDGANMITGSFENRSKSVFVVQANVYDNPELLKNIPSYLNILKNVAAGQATKAAFGEWF